jgi:hypothetical protein
MNTLNISSQRIIVPFECPATSIDLGQVQANDQVLFWTQSGCYGFLITDAERRQGQLVRQGGQPSEATWLGTLAAADGESSLEVATIKTGARAMFQISSEGRTRRMLTSVITKIVIIRQTAFFLT